MQLLYMRLLHVGLKGDVKMAKMSSREEFYLCLA